MKRAAKQSGPASALFPLPCACQNLRRLSRITTRIYDHELRKSGLEVTQFGVLTALAATGEVNQKRLSAGLAMDSTTLTRTMCPLVTSGWVEMKPGQDKRERLFSLTPAGRQQLAEAAPHWERAEKRFRKQMSDTSWREMKESVSRMTEAAANA